MSADPARAIALAREALRRASRTLPPAELNDILPALSAAERAISGVDLVDQVEEMDLLSAAATSGDRDCAKSALYEAGETPGHDPVGQAGACATDRRQRIVAILNQGAVTP